MYIPRLLENRIKEYINLDKAIVILGARQTGKTTLIQNLASELKNYLYIDCDDPTERLLLEEANAERLKNIFSGYKYVFIDEIQRVKNIGITLKLIVDRIKNIKVVVSGSSSFNIYSALEEPLTGRKWEFELYPLLWRELQNKFGLLSQLKLLNQRLILGMYPEIVVREQKKEEALKTLVKSYLFKDVLAFKGIRKSEYIEKLTVALALQTGNQVSYLELSRLVGIDKNTVEKYIDLLEKSYIIFRLPSFQNNPRTELKKAKKIFFWDTGVRNAIINDLRDVSLRQDVGHLWENFFIAEKIKLAHTLGKDCKYYFWRTKNQQEVDLVEVCGKEINAYEIKWNERKARFSAKFKELYPQAKTFVITPDNFYEYL